MDLNRFTEKAREALAGAQKIAARLNHQQIDLEHVLSSLLEQDRGLAPAILAKADVPVDQLRTKLTVELERMPRVTGSSVSNSMFLSLRIWLMCSMCYNSSTDSPVR